MSTTGCSALMSHYYQTCYKDQIRARLKLNRFVIYLDLTYIYILHLKLLNFNTLLKCIIVVTNQSYRPTFRGCCRRTHRVFTHNLLKLWWASFYWSGIRTICTHRKTKWKNIIPVKKGSCALMVAISVNIDIPLLSTTIAY